MQRFLRLDPSIPVVYGRLVDGEIRQYKGRAIVMIDYSEDQHILWTIVDDATGQIWTIRNAMVRVQGNESIGTKHEQIDRT
jgi:hypothetical protein